LIADMHEQAHLELIRGDSHDVRASVIWLHGLGANGYDFAPVVIFKKPCSQL